MVKILERVNLQSLNTFGIEAYCDHFTEINSIQDFQSLIHDPIYQSKPKLILGGGSNILFTKDFNGLVIKNNLKGIEIVKDESEYAWVKVAAGEVWHDFVLWCISHQLNGLENLSLIPGCVGASPMQNIGAYGIEIKDLFESLEAYSMDKTELRVFNASDCEFGYRESVFKHQFKNKYFITSVTFKLLKKPNLNTSYGAINAELEKMGIKLPTPADVSKAVIKIRQSKLPDPKVTGNAGSFFKNPEVNAELYLYLKSKFENLVAYPLSNGNYKLAAGWLIEHCGLKGFELNGAAVHQLQALVLINKSNAKGSAVLELSSYVMKKVFDTFDVELEREVNIV
jgi:UDP-N-acetylmuramate dehydrogenase